MISDSFWQQLQEWAIKLFDDNPEIVGWINELEVDWDQLVQQAIYFLKVRSRYDSGFHLQCGKNNCKRGYELCDCFCICRIRFTSERKIRRTGQ